MTPPQPPVTTAPATGLTGFPSIDGAYNEVIGDGGGLRPAWATLAPGLDALGPDTIRQRWAAAQRVMQENGVTYNVYGDPRGMHRPWALDPVPLVIPAAEWADVEAALVQRARLLNRVLADLYGPSKLLETRQLPSALVFANPNFLRPCVGLKPAGGRHLTLLAFDLARSPEGRWWVVNHRTQAPSGAGYALENRLIISRILPDLFRDCGVSRLAKFFGDLRDTLVEMSPRKNDDPHVALLTPGPHNETYFEHAYLARYLGFTLVEGGDLTVRDRRVYLKTLGGLQQIDVLLRRTDDGFCDPLELRSESVLGVAGLVQANAAGHVAVANALGSGLIETQSIMPFLPKLCRELLGEELGLPGVATWWCGQPKELAYVLDHLDTLVVKAAFAGDALQPVFGAYLTKQERSALREQILERPHRYLAQESVSLSTAPVWNDGVFSPRHVMLRAYVVATKDGYTVMPGGLARVSAAQDSMVVSMQHGGGSKDAWVLSDKPATSGRLVPPESRPVHVSRSGHLLPSRVADTLFWLGRYVERAEGLIQLLRAILIRLTEETFPVGSPELPRLFKVLTEQIGRPLESEPAHHPLVHHQATMAYVSSACFDPDHPESLAACVEKAQQLASIVRDRISLDTWRVVRQIGQTLEHHRTDPHDPTAVLAVVEDLVTPVAAFSGLNNESMTHGHGWRFLDLGRRIERAGFVVNLMQLLAVDVDQHESSILSALLAITNSDMTYRSRYRMSMAALPAVDLLLLDETNPRGVAFQLIRAEAHVGALPADRVEGQRTQEEKAVLSMLASLRLSDANELAAVDGNARVRLRQLLDTLQARLPEFSDLLNQDYLAHAQARQTLASPAADALYGEEQTI